MLKCAPNGQWAEVGFASVCVDGLCLAKTDPVSKTKNNNNFRSNLHIHDVLQRKEIGKENLIPAAGNLSSIESEIQENSRRRIQPKQELAADPQSDAGDLAVAAYAGHHRRLLHRPVLHRIRSRRDPIT